VSPSRAWSGAGGLRRARRFCARSARLAQFGRIVLQLYDRPLLEILGLPCGSPTLALSSKYLARSDKSASVAAATKGRNPEPTHVAPEQALTFRCGNEKQREPVMSLEVTLVIVLGALALWTEVDKLMKRRPQPSSVAHEAATRGKRNKALPLQ